MRSGRFFDQFFKALGRRWDSPQGESVSHPMTLNSVSGRLLLFIVTLIAASYFTVNCQTSHLTVGCSQEAANVVVDQP